MKFQKARFMLISTVVLGITGAVPAWAAGSHAGAHHGAAFGEPGMEKDVVRTINIQANNMEFDIKELKVKSGETIKFIINNPDDVEHDFTIGPPDLQAKHREEMMEMMEKSGGGKMMSMMHKDPNAVFLEPGQTKELIWKFGETKDLEYACNVPGHYDAGMKGKFEVLPRHADQESDRKEQ